MWSLGKKKEKESLLFSDLENVVVDFNLPKELQTQIQMIGLASIDVKRLKVLQPIVKKHTDGLVENFYDNIMKEPSLMEIINKHSNLNKLGKTMYNHIIQIFSGEVNQSYVMQRKRIAHVHVHIGLGTKWYINAFQQLLNAILEVLHKEVSNKHELFDSVISLQKMFSLEQQLVLEAYELREEEIREKQVKEKEEIQRKMKETAHELSAIAEETSSSLEDLVSQFENIKSLTDNGHQSIIKVESLSEDGKVRMGEEMKSAQNVEVQISYLQKEISEMFQLSQKVDSVVEVVASIASQINLLALNATIESARAGEHGRGFAVVANEIRNLSTLTKQSTENIATLVKEISNQVGNVKESVTLFNEVVIKNKDITEETIQFFNEIVEAVKHSKNKTEIVFKEIKDSGLIINQLHQATAEIADSAERLSQ